MQQSKYDAIIKDVANSGFTGYYKKGICMTLTNGSMVVTVWKPKRYPGFETGKVYKDAMIEFSSNGANFFDYQKMKKIDMAIEQAIDYLNCEKENLIDRNQKSNYELVDAEVLEKKKTIALRYSQLELGGVYLDEKGKKWIFLGKGTLFLDGVQNNRSKDEWSFSEYMYMEFPNDSMEQIGVNEFQTEFHPYPDTYSSKKRFFEKVGQLEIQPDIPILIHCGSEVFEVCNGLAPLSFFERMEQEGESVYKNIEVSKTVKITIKKIMSLNIIFLVVSLQM